MYIIIVRRTTSGDPLKQQKGLRIAGGDGRSPPRLKPICSNIPVLGLFLTATFFDPPGRRRLGGHGWRV